MTEYGISILVLGRRVLNPTRWATMSEALIVALACPDELEAKVVPCESPVIGASWEGGVYSGPARL